MLSVKQGGIKYNEGSFIKNVLIKLPALFKQHFSPS